MKNTPVILSSLILILVNLIPLYGAWALNWSVGAILMLFWTENVIIGILNVCKMWQVRKLNTGTEKSKGSILFFIMHYGIFTGVHGVFVAVFSFADIFSSNSTFLFSTFMIGVAGLWVSHVLSYYINFIQNNEYKHTTIGKLFVQPYKRVIVLHLTVILGAVFIFSDSTSIWAIVLLVVFKTIIDLLAHLVEHLFIFKQDGRILRKPHLK